MVRRGDGLCAFGGILCVNGWGFVGSFNALQGDLGSRVRKGELK
jgi:hypothetical protein